MTTITVVGLTLGVTVPSAASAAPLATARLERTLYMTRTPHNEPTAKMHKSIYLAAGYYSFHFGLARTDGNSPFYVKGSIASQNFHVPKKGWYKWDCSLKAAEFYSAYCLISGVNNDYSYGGIATSNFTVSKSGWYKMASYLVAK
jgi:hypothetical protein